MPNAGHRKVVTALLLGMAAILGATGCKQLVDDPTEHAAVVTLRNDLSVSAQVRSCGDSRCTSFPSDVTNTLSRDQDLPVNVGTDCDCPEAYAVMVPGQPTACLLISAIDARREFVGLSAATPCA